MAYTYIPIETMMKMEPDLPCRRIRRSECYKSHGQPLYMTLRPRPGARSTGCPGAGFRHLYRPGMEEYVKRQIDEQHLGEIFELLFGDDGSPCAPGSGMNCGRKEEGNSSVKTTTGDVSRCKKPCNGESCKEKCDGGQSESCESVACCPECPQQCGLASNKDGATSSQGKEHHVFQMDKLLDHMFRLMTGQPMEENNDCKNPDKVSGNAKTQQPMSGDQSEESANGSIYNCEDKCSGDSLEDESPNVEAMDDKSLDNNPLNEPMDVRCQESESIEDETLEEMSKEDQSQESELIGEETLVEKPKDDQPLENKLLGKDNHMPDDQHVPDDRPISEGSSKFSVSFNMTEYEPEDIKVRLSNGQLEVSAARDVMEDGMTSHHSMQRMIKLPPNVDEDTIKCEFLDNGQMVISADKRNITENKVLTIEVLS